MYMYCKAVHGKLVLEDVEGFVWQYESFRFDDDKVPLVVSAVHAQVSETTQFIFPSWRIQKLVSNLCCVYGCTILLEIELELTRSYKTSL